MARASIELVKGMAASKRRGSLMLNEDPSVQQRVAEAEALTDAGRAYVRDVVVDLLNSLYTGAELSWDQRIDFDWPVLLP